MKLAHIRGAEDFPQLVTHDNPNEHHVAVRMTGHGRGSLWLDGQEVKGCTAFRIDVAPSSMNHVQITVATSSLEFVGPGNVMRQHRPLPSAMPPDTFMLEDFYVRMLGEIDHARGRAVLYRRVGEDDTTVRRIPKPQWERHAVQVRDYLEAA